MGGIAGALRKELVRAMLERTQSIDLSKMMAMFGATEPVSYEDVEEKLNIAYVNRQEVALAMDVFIPKKATGTELPVIVDVHGGGLFMGDRGINRPYCRMLAHRGYLVFSLEYRLAPKVTIMQQFDDVCAGMDLVGSMLVDYDVDFTRMFLVADSAGAYLAAYVAAMHNSEKLQDVIGYKPSRMVFAAVGFICGMFYTSRTLEEQTFGNRLEDQEFLRYMNIEHPEIVNHLPPAFLLTSCGDTFNNYSFRFHEALKKAGKTSKLLYLGDEELMHIFPVMNPEHLRSIEAMDRMLAWMEAQADIRRENRQTDSAVTRAIRKVEKRIADGSINNQKAWSNLKERISCDPALLQRTIVIDCTRGYTYEQMFREWERYAKVFSGLEICAGNHSRVALCGAITAEPLFALYGLNMTGAEVSLFSYPDFLPGGMWKTMIEKEKITDLIISDIMVTPRIWEEIRADKEQLGLRHVVLLHSLMGGPTVGPAELTWNEFNYHSLRRRPDTVFMGDLFEKYAETPIRFDKSRGDRIAFIFHTSGTTHGTRKMLPFTDRVFNETLKLFPNGYREVIKDQDYRGQICVINTFDMSSVHSLAGMFHGPVARGETIVLTFFGFMHPKFLKAIAYYNVTVMSITGFMVDQWIDSPGMKEIDFSSLRFIGISGGYIPPEKMEKYQAYFREHGYKYDITFAYGMSEAGGKPIFASKEQAKQDILGYPEDPENFRLKDENDGLFYMLSDGPRTGVLYRLSDTRPNNELDGQILYEYTELDGKDFLCTNDLVRVNQDGSIAFAGRTDKYFENNEGIRFDSGIVEQHLAGHPAINRCAIVPVMEKRIHDTVPVLYAVPAEKGANAAKSILDAFMDIYVKERKIAADQLPTQFMIVEDIPLNSNGKLDIFRITRERLEGDAYNLIPVMTDGKLTEIRMEHVKKLNSMKAGTLPRGMENHSAYNIFELFTGATSDSETDNFPDPFVLLERLLYGEKKEKNGFTISKIPEGVRKGIMKYGNRILAIPNGRKWGTSDIED